MSDDLPKPTKEISRIVQEADEADVSLAADFVDFIKHNKKWWLVPLLLSLAVVGLLATVGGSALGPFVYPML